MKKTHIAVLVFIVLGIAKLPLEQRATQRFREHGIITAPVNLGGLENAGQTVIAGALGGMRSLAASMTYLQAFAAFEEVKWSEVESLLTLTTRLEPRLDFYWDDAGTRMGLDAASYYRYDKSRPSLHRRKNFREYVQRGIEFLDEGLKHCPQSHRLHERLAFFYTERVEPPDHRQAAQHYLAAFRNGGLAFNQRAAAYQMVLIPDDREAWQQAYTILLSTYNRGRPYSSVLRDLRILEQRLNVPPAQRIPVTEPSQR